MAIRSLFVFIADLANLNRDLKKEWLTDQRGHSYS